MNTQTDWMQRAATSGNVERIEAYFSGHGYELHRHDTYAIGRTLTGVQSFHYRRAMRHSLPGSTIVLHPDEVHDGEAGTEAGFRYRMVYVPPALIQQILGGRTLPFIETGIATDARLYAASSALLHGMEKIVDPLEEDDALYDLAQALCAAAAAPHARRKPDYAAAERARQYIHDTQNGIVLLDDLARAAGVDRWKLSRDFRALYGTSPYRYVVMRRLERARTLIGAGQALAQVAVDTGFTDQSHMTRHYTQVYGISPARWRKILEAA